MFTSKIVWGQPLGQLLIQSVSITKKFQHRMSETFSGKLVCMLVIVIMVLTWLQFLIVTNLSVQILTFVRVWHIVEVFSSRMILGLHCSGQMSKCVWRCVGEQFSNEKWFWIEWSMVALGGTKNTGLFYRWQFEFTEILGGDPVAHCCAILYVVAE